MYFSKISINNLAEPCWNLITMQSSVQAYQTFQRASFAGPIFLGICDFILVLFLPATELNTLQILLTLGSSEHHSHKVRDIDSND